MCDPITLMTAGASVLSTALGVVRQVHDAEAGRAGHRQLAARQLEAATAREQQALLAEQDAAAEVERSRADTARRAGSLQAKLAAQGGDLAGSPVDVLGDLAASGEEDALSLSYRGMRAAWDHRVGAAAHRTEARRFHGAAGRVDPTLGIVRGLLS